MTKAPQTILSLSTEPLPVVSSISLLPCSLAFDGPAPISTYFHPRAYDPQDATEQAIGRGGGGQHRQAAFRGRRLISSFMPVPRGYTGLVFSTRAAVPPTATEDDLEEELEAIQQEKNRKAREERAAKRAKVSQGDKEAGEGDQLTRRSPRKAAKEARERAIKAAKEKAKGKGKVATKFSLDDSEEEEEEEEEEETAERARQMEDEGKVTEGEQTEAEDSKGDDQVSKIEVDETLSTTAVLETSVDGAGSEVTATSSAVTTERVFASEETAVEEPSAFPSDPISVPAPLLSRTSTSLSTHLHLPTTPSSFFISEEAETTTPTTTTLARDEKHLNPCSTFKEIEIWNPDFMIAGGRVMEEDQVARSVQEWIGLANKIHAY